MTERITNKNLENRRKEVVRLLNLHRHDINMARKQVDYPVELYLGATAGSTFLAKSWYHDYLVFGTKREVYDFMGGMIKYAWLLGDESWKSEDTIRTLEQVVSSHLEGCPCQDCVAWRNW